MGGFSCKSQSSRLKFKIDQWRKFSQKKGGEGDFFYRGRVTVFTEKGLRFGHWLGQICISYLHKFLHFTPKFINVLNKRETVGPVAQSV